MRIQALICTLAFTLCACGSSDETTSSTSGGGEDPGESCEGYSPGDACIDDDNFTQCQQMASECPGAVQVMESCPLQFACPSEGGTDDSVPGPVCNGHSASDACMDDDNFAQCQQMEAECPGEILEAESCPAQFSCP